MTTPKLAPVALVAMVATVWAEPIGEDDAPVLARDREPTAAEVDGAPVPGSESGRIDAGEPTDSTARKVARGVLLVPRLALEGAFAPVRAGIWAYDRYQLKERYLDLFFNDARTMGILPSAKLESGYGLTLGARIVHRDAFGKREHIGLSAATGGRFRQVTSLELHSGDRLGERAELELAGDFERRPKDAFYGIGNTDGEEARFRQQIARATASLDTRIAGPFHARVAGAIADFTFDRSEQGPPIDELYPMATMVGFAGVRHTYSELELRWDSRRPTSLLESRAVRASGWLLAGYGGRIVPLDDGTSYWRFGADLQRFIRLGVGPRVLAARLYGEMVTATHDEVPFTQLPRLGGTTLLRGYPADRFRDRIAALGSLEYSWDLSFELAASIFVDVGRVYSDIDEVTLSGLRTGYGVGLQAFSERSFVVRASIASSTDGGVFFGLAFDPVFDLPAREVRR